MTMDEKKIVGAIDQSILRNETVEVLVESVPSALDMIEEYWDGETDHVDDLPDEDRRYCDVWSVDAGFRLRLYTE